MGFWSSVIDAIKEADIVLFILDARMPELSYNEDLAERIESLNKKVLLVLNKTDLVSKEVLSRLKKEYPHAFFVSGTKSFTVKRLRIALQIEAKKFSPEKLGVGIVGYPNVGKSAITNILSRGAKTKVSPRAGTTTGNQWAASSRFKIIDSPGVISFGDDEIKLGILGAKNPENIRNPEYVATEIIKIVLNNNPKRLEEIYNVKPESNDEYEILLQIGQSKKLLKKGGLVEETRTALMVIRDWQTGKLKI
jgi:ribosome biogenesis GTPase A